jgi:hypothetical protein
VTSDPPYAGDRYDTSPPAKLVSDISFVVVQFQKNPLFHHLN